MAQVEVTVYFNEISQQVMSFDSKLILLKATGDATTPTKLSYYGNQTNPRNPTVEYVVTEDIDTIVANVGCALVSTNIWPSNATESIQYAFPSAGWQITDVSDFGTPNVNSIICYRYNQYNSEDTITDLVDAANACGGGGDTYTADNGLSASTATNFQLGSSSAPGAPLLHTSYIDAGNSLQLQINSALPLGSGKDAAFRVVNSADSGAIYASSEAGTAISGYTATGTAAVLGIATSSGQGVIGQAVTDKGVGGISNSGAGVFGYSISGAGGHFIIAPNLGNTNNVKTVLEIERDVTGTAANGIGQNVSFICRSDDGSRLEANGLISKLTDAGASTRTSQFIITGTLNNAAAADLARFNGNGTMQWPAYGAGAITSDASGNLTSASDERLKDIQGDFNTGLEGIMELQPILFKYNEESGLETEHTYAGFSAQNVKEHIPFGTGEDTKGYLSLQDRPIMAALVNSVKELQEQINDLKKQLSNAK